MEGQVLEVRKMLEHSRQKTIMIWDPPYGMLNTEVSLWAIQLLDEDGKLVRSCTCGLRPTKGLSL